VSQKTGPGKGKLLYMFALCKKDNADIKKNYKVVRRKILDSIGEDCDEI
jgi:hypothetical protein